MAAGELTCSLNGGIHRKSLSSDVTSSCCEISDYNTFDDEELPVDRTKNRKLLLSTFCIADFLVGMFYSLLAPFFAVEVSRHLYIFLALMTKVLLTLY